jgi:DNA-nicking Smr family endonuclease
LNSKISDKDKKDWESFISKNEALPNKDKDNKKNKVNKIELIDLHGYSLDDANLAIKDFITKSYKSGINKLIVVTGKGLHSDQDKDPYVSKKLGILKYSVPEYIKNNFELMEVINFMEKAKIEDGGEGAFYIYLKKKKFNQR